MAPPKAGGKPTASLAALKSMMAAKAAAEAEAKRIAAEEEARVAEEDRIEAERQLAEETIKAAKREADRIEKEKLRKEGKLLSKSERERAERNRIKLEQLALSGAVSLNLPTDKDHPSSGISLEDSTAIKKKKPVYITKKKNVSALISKNTVSEDKPINEPVVEEVLDSWEAALSDDSDTEPTVPLSNAILSTVEKLENHSANLPIYAADDAVETTVEVNNSNEKKKKGKKDLRSPICCILGHVDTGKTKLLDKIRQTNVQEGEAGGITQQIGATYFPAETICEKTAHLKPPLDVQVPGLLIIDTPGHESFTNLRSRGSSLCNIAILVVDIMHGLEPQTLESLNLLRQRKTPFIVALNKIDRLYGWKACPGLSLQECLEQQALSVQKEFEDRLSKAMLAFAEQGLNSCVSFRNDDLRRCVSLVPTSAITGDGIPDMIQLLVDLTQRMMSSDLLYVSTNLQCTVLEVKVIEGLGTTIDVILSNGILNEGDRIVVAGLNGPIVTTIRALLTPQPLRELRVKSAYIHHKRIKAAQGIKISAPDLDKCIPGSPLFVVTNDDDEEEVLERVRSDVDSVLNSVDTTGKGVCVQASTLGSLEALLSFLKSSKIPVAAINIGPIHKKDITRASVMLEQGAKEFAVILAFDVKVDKEMEEFADELDVRIFKADIIYHLFDQFTAYMHDLVEAKRKALAPDAVFPCVLRIVPGCVFNKRSPLVVGVDVVEGVLRVGTPLSAVTAENGIVSLGKVTSIEANHKAQTSVRRGGSSVAIKIENASWEPCRMYGRHFTERDPLMSRITRESIDVLKANFRDDLEKEDWALVVKLKKVFSIQ